MLRLIQGYNLSFPIYLDMEDKVQAVLSDSERGNIASVFCNIIQNEGYKVGIYANKNWWTNYLTDSAFNNSLWYKWVAQYNSSCTYSGNYTMWQYTSSGYVNGINTNVDIFHIDYETYNSGAKYISYLLTPATVCLAIPLYRQISVLKEHAKEVFIGILAGVLASMGSILLMSYLFGLTHEQYVTLLPKSITTAIGMGVSEELGGIQTITVAVIIITGVLGNIIAEAVLKIFRIKEPVAKGLAIGTASHAIGTTKALEIGEIEGAMSSLSVAVAGLMTVISASIFANMM